MNGRVVQLLSIHRYPEFLVDLIVSRALFACVGALFNFRVGPDARIRGLPIVSLARGSSIRIGRHSYLVSRSRITALGVNHPIIIRTLKTSARIRIGDHFRASGVTLCAAKAILIGDRVVMGANVTVVDTDFHSLNLSLPSSGELDGE